MKKPTIKTIFTVLLLITAVFSFTGCEFLGELFAILAAPEGYVYDAKTGEPLEGVTVKLEPVSDNDLSTATAKTNSNGYYTFEEVEYGTFELTASKTDYIFTELVVDVSGLSQELPLMGGFIPGDEVFSIVVFWDEDFADVDAFLSMPNGYKGTATVDPSNFYSTSSAVSDGFFPVGGNSADRLSVTSSIQTVTDPGDSTVTVAELDVDNVGGVDQPAGGPETMSVYTFPFFQNSLTGSYSPTAADRSKLPLTGTYAWVGTMEYSLGTWTDVNDAAADNVFGTQNPDALLASADPTQTAANPVVYIFDSDGQKGSIRLPGYMDIETASILRINMFYDTSDVVGGAYAEYFQFLPDINTFSDRDSIDRNISSAEPIVIKGR